jgi:hypothetical protein
VAHQVASPTASSTSLCKRASAAVRADLLSSAQDPWTLRGAHTVCEDAMWSAGALQVPARHDLSWELAHGVAYEVAESVLGDLIGYASRAGAGPRCHRTVGRGAHRLRDRAPLADLERPRKLRTVIKVHGAG